MSPVVPERDDEDSAVEHDVGKGHILPDCEHVHREQRESHDLVVAHIWRQIKGGPYSLAGGRSA